LLRIVPLPSMCLGGRPSGAVFRGLLTQPSSESHDTGVRRIRPVSQSVAPEALMTGICAYG